jgi:hypothetical protein
MAAPNARSSCHAFIIIDGLLNARSRILFSRSLLASAFSLPLKHVAAEEMHLFTPLSPAKHGLAYFIYRRIELLLLQETPYDATSHRDYYNGPIDTLIVH